MTTILPCFLNKDTVLAQRYIIQRMLANVANSRLYLVADKEKPKQVWVVKQWTMDRDFQGNYTDEFRARFKGIVEIVSKCQHPNIARIVDHFEEGGYLFMVMEYVEGCSLFDLAFCRMDHHFPELVVLDWAIQVCNALSYLHALPTPILFLDMKPENIMLDSNGTIKFVDFGAVNRYSEGNSVIESHLSPGYMPPEAEQGLPLDIRSDIYALGATIFHLLTRKPPKHCSKPLPSVSEFNSSLSLNIGRAIAKATRLAPEQRYRSIEELSSTLIDIRQARFTSILNKVATKKICLADPHPSNHPTAKKILIFKFFASIFPAKWIGHFLFHSGELYASECEYQRALIQNKTDGELYKNLGIILFETKRYEQARKILATVSAKRPGDLSVHQHLGRVYYFLGLFQDALVCYEKVNKLNPIVASYHAEMGMIYWAMGGWQDAYLAYKKAAELDPKNSDYKNKHGYAKIIMELERRVNGIDRNNNPELYAEISRKLADLFMREGKQWNENLHKFPSKRLIACTMYRNSIAALDGICTTSDDWRQLGEAYLAVAALEGITDDLEKAVEVFEKVTIIKNPQSIVIEHCMTLGRHLNMSSKDLEICFYNLLLKFIKDKPMECKDIGNSLMEEKRYEQATLFFEQACARISTDGSLYHEAGVANYDCGNFMKATERLQQAISLDYKKPNTYYALGDSYWARCKWGAALTAYRQAQHLEPENERFIGAVSKTRECVKWSRKYKNAQESYKNYPVEENRVALVESARDYVHFLTSQSDGWEATTYFPGARRIAQYLLRLAEKIIQPICSEESDWLFLAYIHIKQGNLEQNQENGENIYYQRALSVLELIESQSQNPVIHQMLKEIRANLYPTT